MLALAAVGALPGQTQAQGLPPRPELTPVPQPDTGGDDDNDDAPALGRITGTVIDLTTGAPAPGVQVVVGDTTVTTDANGNYDRNGLAEDSYQVSLNLDPARGTPAQGPQTVSLAAGATVVQHLAFRSPLAPTPEPTPIPAPIALPDTSGTDGTGSLLLIAALGLLGAGAAVRRRMR
jgi:hypothetical protein